MAQRLKPGRGFAASYKPAVLVNQEKVITALALDASGETAVVATMLDQAERLMQAALTGILLDARYFHDEVIDATLARDISLLCPSPVKQDADGNGTVGRKFHKSQFQYDLVSDSYAVALLRSRARLHCTRWPATSPVQ